MRKRIGLIRFQVMSPEMIRKISAVEVRTPDTYDEDGFPIEGGLMDSRMGVVDPGLRCKTCGQKMNRCPGHFGHVELVRPVVHSEYVRYIEMFLNATCKKCGKVALPQSKVEAVVNKLKGPEALSVLSKKGSDVRKCPHCGAERMKVVLEKPTNFYEGDKRIWPTEIRERLERIPDSELQMIGFDPSIMRPEWLVLTALPVAPVTVRPSIVLETGERAEDDLTHKLADILRINIRLRENVEAGAPQLIIEDLWDLLQYHVTTYFNNEAPGVPPARHRSGRILKTLIQRLKGKEGRLRYNLSGKRVNFAGRAVISPDPFLGIDEVGVPIEMASSITVPFHVTEWNVDEAKKLVLSEEYPRALYVVRPDGTRKIVTVNNKEELANELAPGYIVERQVSDGDIVLFNRQPSLHRMSMMALKTRVLPGRTLRIPPAICPPYNADFDGDEMNIHFLQTKEAQTEARELLISSNHIISPRYGAPIISLSQDFVTSLFILTHNSTRVDRKTAMQMMYAVGIKDLPEEEEDGKYSGKALVSMVLPEGLNLEFRSKYCDFLRSLKRCKDCKNCPFDAYVVIRDGKLVNGVLDKNAVGEAKGKLLDVVTRKYGTERAKKLIEDLCRITMVFFRKYGLTVSYSGLKVSDKTKKKVKQIVDKGVDEAQRYVELYEKQELEPIPGKNVDDSLDAYVIQALQKAEKEVTRVVVSEVFEKAERSLKAVDFVTMILSGGRGNPKNIKDLMGVQGQAAVREKRPNRGFQYRVTSHFKRGDLSVYAKGFARNCLRDGLSMDELFFWGMGGRMGEVDKGVSTQISGYYYRRLSNALMDLLVYPDLSVREVTTGNIIQFLYGDDGIFPMNTEKGRPPFELLLEGVMKGE